MQTMTSLFGERIDKLTKVAYAKIVFYRNIAVVEFNEGILLEIDRMEEVLMIISEYFGPDKKWHYISNRVHSYTSVPTDLGKLAPHISKVLSVNLVGYGNLAISSAQFEKPFWPVTVNIHGNLEGAVEELVKANTA